MACTKSQQNIRTIHFMLRLAAFWRSIFIKETIQPYHIDVVGAKCYHREDRQEENMGAFDHASLSPDGNDVLTLARLAAAAYSPDNPGQLPEGWYDATVQVGGVPTTG